MEKKIFVMVMSILAVCFLAAQTCNIQGVTTGLASDCVGEGDVVCEGTEAYECQIAQFGVGYYVTRALGFDESECGAIPEELSALCTPDPDSCPAGYVCNGATRNCVKETSESCPQGYLWNKDAERCEEAPALLDADKDGIQDTIDRDDDNDRFTDLQEMAANTNPLNPTEIPIGCDSTNTTDTSCADSGSGLICSSFDVCVPQCTSKNDCSINFVCVERACVLKDSDEDGVPDSVDVCPGYNDTIDTDDNGVPDGCDTASGTVTLIS